MHPITTTQASTKAPADGLGLVGKSAKTKSTKAESTEGAKSMKYKSVKSKSEKGDADVDVIIWQYYCCSPLAAYSKVILFVEIYPSRNNNSGMINSTPHGTMTVLEWAARNLYCSLLAAV